MADHDSGENAAQSPAEDAQAAADDVKARFREALDRKQGAAHRSAQGRANTGTVHGSEAGGGSKRTFRRKTG
jgi:Family of unknown function (DUF5302)